MNFQKEPILRTKIVKIFFSQMFAGELHQHRRRSESVVNEFMDTFHEPGKKSNV